MEFSRQAYWSGLPFSTEGDILNPGIVFSGGSDSKESSCNAGDLGLISGLGRLPGEGNGNLLQYACLENSMDRGAWQVIVPGVTESNRTE